MGHLCVIIGGELIGEDVLNLTVGATADVCAVVAEDDEDGGILEHAFHFQVTQEATNLVVGLLKVAGIGLHESRIDLSLVNGKAVPGWNARTTWR